MEEKLKSLFLKLQDVFHPERGLENSATKERAKNFPAASSDLAISQEDKCVFKSLLFYVKETVLKPWSDNQAEFLVLTCFEDDDLNQVNYMSVLSSFGFARGDKTSLEMVKKYLKNHCDQFYPNAPLLMNNLGVMFNENALFEESEECFNMAKVYCQHQDNIKNAVITLNQAVLKKTLGKYKEAANLASTAASLCHDISMRATNYAQLPVKLLGRVADMLKEFGNHQMLKKILRTAVYFDIPGADKAVAAVLSRQLMKIQLEGMEKKIEAKEVKDFISHLLAFLTKPDASKMSMNAELIRIVIQAAKICRIAGQCQEACNLLKKLQSIFLLVHGENSFLYGSLLYQMGCFLHGSGRFGDAETALKQAEVILFCHCGENHYSVALCRSVLGSCILLKSNAKDAFEYLNKALTVFKKLNPIHPEVGEITLKFAFFYAEERNFQQAQETLQEAETIFKLSCGEASCKTASAYFQVGMILQRFKQFRLSAVEKVQKGIEMMVNLGMNLNHPDVMFWSSFLGVLKQSLGLVKEAEKCFTDVQNRVPFCDDLGSKETQILTTEDWFLHYRDRADEWRSSSSFLKAQVVSLANLVHIEGGDKRIQYLDKLVCCLEDEEIEKIHVRDFAGQDVFLFTHKIPSFNRLAVLIVHVFDSLPDRLGADAGTNSKMFLSSSAEKSPFTLFLSIQGRGLDMKEINCMTSSFRESVKMLFLQPKFRKGFAEGKDLYLELPTPADISSFSSHFDCLPLLVELELTKSKEQEQCDEFDFLTSWQSSVDSATHSVPHVSYFSFRCVNQREMEFVFDHLSQNLGQKLALNGFQEDMNVISDVSPEENVASFIFQESQSLFLTIVAGNLSVIVKCCSFKESGAHCLCSSIRNALTVTIESLLDIVSVNLETSMLLDCEGIGSVLGHEEYLSGNCSQSVNCNPVSSGLTLESVNSTIPDQESKTDFTSTRKLRVTLLSSEWRSIKGGLSTINRELAIQLAKHPSVEVSVYLPRCSEEDKRVAASHSVHLIKAKEMPGYDPVDWLSFLPEHHAVDCVIGHGAVLGRQVQLIKRNHSCKWVQVVHTSPEEIGMYKGYGEHISKGEEKHQAEVELCKLVDQVVAVGPKLFEAYSGYLRACGKDQKVFSLTPGVFSEFADIRHANEERRNFKVLVFGCEDDAEFKVKGYDIAAHAVAQLKDRCYTLVFVSAPSGKEEEVQDLLLDYGIDRSQLTVQCFNGSREQLAQLFCEVDLAIMPSRTEGFGLAALEALSAGLPVLVSGNSGLGQALKKVQYGSSCVVDSEDPKDWASAIKVVRHKDREIRLFESKILRETYAKMYNWKGQCNRLIETMLNITRGSLKALQPLKKDKGPTLLQPWRHTIPQVDESSGRSPTHHSEANEFLGKQVSGTHRCQPLKSSVCLENLDVIHPLCYPHDKFDHVDVGLCLLECLLNHSRSVSHGEKRLDSYGPLSADVVECGSDIPNYSSLSSSIFSSCASSSLNSMPTTPSTFPLADYNLFESTKSTCEGLSSVDKLKECKAGPSSDVICLCESREHLCDNPLRITKCSRLSVNLPKEPSLSVDACAFSQSSYEECLNVEQSCCHLETQETKQSKTFTVKNISGAEEVLISSTDQKAALQNISSKDKDSSIGNASKLLTTQCVEDLCANQSLKLEESHQSIQGPLSGAHSDKVDTGTVTEDFFRTLLANLEDELAASQRDHHDLEQQIRKLEEKLKQSEEEKRELQADLGRYLFLEEKEKRRGRLLGGATAVQEPGLSMRSRLLEISDSLSSAEVKKIKFLLKSKVNGFRLARMREAFELFEELETNGLFSLNYVGQLLGEIQRYDLVEKLGIHGPLPRTRKGSNSSVESDHGSNSAKSTPVQDNISDEQTDGPEMEIQMDYAPSSKNYCELTSSDENGTSLRAEETDHDQSQCSSIFSSGSSVEEDSDIRLSSKSVENVVLVEESPKSPIPSDVMSLSNSSCCSSDLVANSHKTTPAISNNTLQASFEVDGFQVMSDGSQSASGYSNLSPTTWDTQGISHLMARPGNEPADKDGQLQGACAGGGKERQVKSHDFCDGTAMVVPYSTKIITECTKTDSSVSSDSGLARTQTIADGGGVSSTQQHVISDGEREITSPSPDATDWQRLGARPKESQRIVVEQVPTEPVVYITDGLAGDFLARHTQDKSLHDSIYKTDGASLFNDIPSQGTSFIDGDISQSSRAQAYVGDCHVASRAEPFIGTGNSLVSGSNRHLGGLYNAELFSDNSGLWSSRLGNDLFSLHSNFLSRNTSTAANNYSLQSDFVHNSSGFAGFHHFDEQTYLSSAPQAPYPPISSDDPVLNRYPGMSGSRFANPSWTDAALTLPGDPVHNAPRFNSFSSEQLTDPAQGASGFTGDDDASAFISNQGSDELAQAQKPNLALGNSRTTTGNIDDDANSAARYQFGNSTTFDGVLAARSTHDTSVLEPRLGDTDNSRVSLLNNTDFGTDSIEASDNSLLALERRVAEACALVERVLREREEREQFGKEIERKEQLIREQRARERREREERELREAENWPQQQEAITARSQWLCEHYQRHCRVRFPCCTQFYPCHRCHNISKACDNEEAKACHATHLKCSHCQHEQEIGEDSAKCRKCGGKMSAYFCAICKHFTSVDKNPYHCEKCGICRIHQDKSFHCEVCNVCLDKRLEGNHKCRPDSGHDECCICLEDAFSGCQILPCSHKVHRECAIAMIQNGIRTCPICRHPLYSQSSRG